jgi:hypothetical protein
LGLLVWCVWLPGWTGGAGGVRGVGGVGGAGGAGCQSVDSREVRTDGRRGREGLEGECCKGRGPVPLSTPPGPLDAPARGVTRTGKGAKVGAGTTGTLSSDPKDVERNWCRDASSLIKASCQTSTAERAGRRRGDARKEGRRAQGTEVEGRGRCYKGRGPRTSHLAPRRPIARGRHTDRGGAELGVGATETRPFQDPINVESDECRDESKPDKA